VGLGLSQLVPLLGAMKCEPSKNKEKVGVLAIGGHCLVIKHNNQPKVGILSRSSVGEGAQPGRNVWRGRGPVVFTIKWSVKKKENITSWP
jgi:hypothetical protein